MTGREDTDMLAAEYVLGTLDADERARVVRDRAHVPALDRAIADWERRLAPLDAATPEVTPRRDILPDILARIDRDTHARTQTAQILQLQRRVTRWRVATLGVGALAASLALVMGLRDTLLSPRGGEQSFVAVFQKDDAAPAFLLSIDLATRTLTIRPVAAERPADKTYQLWIAAERYGNRPRSLGLLDDDARLIRASLDAYEPDVLQTATFGISLEPRGGSPTGQPTSPALHAKLLPARP
jgi:anti-sigma-K factor RskA